MTKKNKKSINNRMNILNNFVLISTIITLLFGIADFVFDILHNSTPDNKNVYAVWFLVFGIFVTVSSLTWMISEIIILVNDKKNKFLDKHLRIVSIIVLSISCVMFVPLWFEGFIPGNNIPLLDRQVYWQVIWIIVWILYLQTNIIMFLISYFNCGKFIQSKK